MGVAPATAADRRPDAPAALTPPPGNPRFPLLDSVRGFAALIVFIVHSYVSLGRLRHVWYAPLIVRFDIGLTIFFVLSGFLLYRPFVASRVLGTPRPSIRAYARGRVLRVVPAYWAALTLLALYPGLPRMWDGAAIYYSLMQDYFSGWSLGGISPAWSVSVEVGFYAALPLLVLLADRLAAGKNPRTALRVNATLLAGIYVLALVYRLAVTHGHVPRLFGIVTPYTIVPATTESTLAGTADWFALGMGVALASVALQSSTRRPRVVRVVERAPSVCWIAALALLFGSILFLFPGVDKPFSFGQWYAGQVVYGLIAVLFLLPAVFGHERGGLPRRILRNPLLSWLGVVSYGFFLWHVSILDKLSHRTIGPLRGSPALLLMAIGLALSLMFAAASYYGLERPILRFKNRRMRADRQATAPAGLESAARAD